MKSYLSFLFILTAAFLLPEASLAQSISLDMGEGEGSLTNRTIQLLLIISVLSIAPGLLIMVTCFPYIVVVLSILRQAIGLQQSPPNMFLVSLALFLTYFVMEPIFLEAWANGIAPLSREEIGIEEAFLRGVAPFREFMELRLDPETYERLASLRPDYVPGAPIEEAPLSVLIPSFMLSEVALAFQIGFLVFLPFLIIDLVVAAILMSMGMMMVPPAIVSLPFKLAFFVVADGWSLIAAGLVESYF